MLVREAIKPWPPSGWSVSYTRDDKLQPDPSAATVVEARARAEGISLVVKCGTSSFSTYLAVPDRIVRKKFVDLLDSSPGKTLSEIATLALD